MPIHMSYLDAVPPPIARAASAALLPPPTRGRAGEKGTPRQGRLRVRPADLPPLPRPLSREGRGEKTGFSAWPRCIDLGIDAVQLYKMRWSCPRHCSAAHCPSSKHGPSPSPSRGAGERGTSRQGRLRVRPADLPPLPRPLSREGRGEETGFSAWPRCIDLGIDAVQPYKMRWSCPRRCSAAQCPSSKRGPAPSPLAGEGRGEGDAPPGAAACQARGPPPSPPAPLPRGERGGNNRMPALQAPSPSIRR